MIAFRVPGCVDHVNFGLYLWVSVSRLTDDHIWPQLLKLPNEMNHVWSSCSLSPSPFLQIEINSITSILVGPLRHLDSHLFSRFFGSKPVPGVWLERISITSYGKHDDSVCGDSPRSSRPSSSC